ncbi:MAG TPA: plastocyanin/azurin family copper-binding protein [Gemmatimonadaceae bacterium]
MRLLRVLGAGTLLVAAACGGGGDGGTTNPPPAQTLGEIRPTPANVALTAGQSTTINVAAINTNGGTISNAGTPTFTTQSATVAEVNAQGVVFGVSAGTTSIDISLSFGGVTKTASVPVVVTGTFGPMATVTASSASNIFQPQIVGVARGGTVTWSFSTVEHNVTFSGGGSPANIPNTVNSSVSRTFGTAGNFPYDCSIHAGMTGTVIVR